jgi:hypothetical protein
MGKEPFCRPVIEDALKGGQFWCGFLAGVLATLLFAWYRGWLTF